MPDLGVPEFWDNGMLVEKVGATVGNHVFIAGIDAIEVAEVSKIGNL